MWDLHVCVACLATDVRMYSMSAANLLEPYRLLTGIEVQSEGMPQKLCWECAALMKKFNMFRHKCERANLLLQHIYNQHDEVSEQDVLTVNREQYNMLSSYSVCPVLVIDLVNLKTKGKKRAKDKMIEENITKESDTDDALMEPIIKIGTNITKNEENNKEINLETDNTELIDDNLAEEDYSQEMQLEYPEKIRHPRKRRQSSNSEQNQKTEGKMAKNFGMKEVPLSQEQQADGMRERKNTVTYRLAPFRCTLCYRAFTMEKTLEKHKLKHEPVSGEFMCDICKLRYKTKFRLLTHMTESHIYKYSCLSCPDVFYNRSTAMSHYAWHNGVKYTCNICGVFFDKQTTHLSHLRSKHSFGHVCVQCGSQFHSEKGLLQHIGLAHKSKRDTVASGDEQATSGPYCAECDIQFTRKQAWTRHILISPKHQHERHICALGCETCGETLPSEESLRNHRVIHRKIQTRENISSNVPCEQCGEVMETPRAYSAHFRSIHPDKTRTHYPAIRAPCMCEICGKIFKCMAVLESHRNQHTGEMGGRPYQCDFCSKRFTWPWTLRIHIRTHTRELLYKCDICERDFTSSSNMKRHKSQVHANESLYTCNICDKSFKDPTYVKFHINYVHMKKPWPKRVRGRRQK